MAAIVPAVSLAADWSTNMTPWPARERERNEPADPIA